MTYRQRHNSPNIKITLMGIMVQQIKCMKGEKNGLAVTFLEQAKNKQLSQTLSSLLYFIQCQILIFILEADIY